MGRDWWRGKKTEGIVYLKTKCQDDTSAAIFAPNVIQEIDV